MTTTGDTALREFGSSATAERGGKYLTFTLAEGGYGIGILRVREIMGMIPITAVPKTPDFVRGVFNLRGKVVPVVDLRLKFGLPSAEVTALTCIIVVEITAGNTSMTVGVIVDAVSEVMDIPELEIEDTPVLDAHARTDFILGMARMGDGVKILLDIDRVLDAEAIRTLRSSLTS